MYTFITNNIFENYNIIILDYPGEYESSGEGNNDSVNEMAISIYDYLNQNELLKNKIIVMGYSFGTYPATYLAANKEVQKLILVGAYDNFYNLYMSRKEPVKAFFNRNNYQSDKYAELVSCRTLIFTSYADRNVEHELTENLASKFNNLYELKIYENLNHMEYFDQKETWELINKFLEED